MNPIRFSLYMVAFISIFIFLILASHKLFFPKDPLRIGINPWPGYEPLVLGKKLGVYDDLGLNVEFVEISSLSDIGHAFQHGYIDIYCGTIAEFVESNIKGMRASQIILLPDYSAGGDVIMARAGIESLKELKGKKVGVEESLLGTFFLSRALEFSGMSLSDVSIVYSEQEFFKKLLKKGEVDAVVSYPPFSLDISDEIEGANKIFDTSDIPKEIIDVLAIAEEKAGDYQNEIKLLQKGWDQTLVYIQSNFHEAMEIMAKRQGLLKEDFISEYEGMKVIPFEEQKELVRTGEVELSIQRIKKIMFPEQYKEFLKDGLENRKYIDISLMGE